jgi:hypothetical protein
MPSVEHQPVSGEVLATCSFCREKSAPRHRLAQNSDASACICLGCADLCHEILFEEAAPEPPAQGEDGREMCPLCQGRGVNANQPEGCSDCWGTGRVG